MHARLFLLSASTALLVWSCQSYEFDKVTPSAIAAEPKTVVLEGEQQPPKVMLVLDRSGSMKTKANDGEDWICCEPRNANCDKFVANPECKWEVLKDLLKGPGHFMEATSGSARHGLVLFPMREQVGSCGPGIVDIPIPTKPGDTVESILEYLDDERSIPRGGTPTAKTLEAVLSNEPFMRPEAGTARYVVLVTDGLPNCNEALRPPCECTAALLVGQTCGPTSCLDKDALVESVKKLKQKGVDTFVIGFGDAVTNSIAQEVLNQAALEGGQAQPGEIKFFQAQTKADLEKMLKRVAIAIDSCSYSLSKPASSPSLVEVNLYDTTTKTPRVVAVGTEWEFECQPDSKACTTSADCPGGYCWTGAGACKGLCTDPSMVVVHDPVCQTIRKSTAKQYELRIVSITSL